jgi:nicotinamide riboside kinase
LTTKLWSQRLYPEHKPQYPYWFDKAIADRAADLYIVASPDTPWVGDTHRQWSNESVATRRNGFFHKIVGELSDLNRNFVVVSGADYESRIGQAKTAVMTHIFKGMDYGFGAK